MKVSYQVPPSALLLGVEEGEYVDDAEDEGEEERLSGGGAGVDALRQDPRGHEEHVRGADGAHPARVGRREEAEREHARRDGGEVPQELQHAPAAPDVLLVGIRVPAIDEQETLREGMIPASRRVRHSGCGREIHATFQSKKH